MTLVPDTENLPNWIHRMIERKDVALIELCIASAGEPKMPGVTYWPLSAATEADKLAAEIVGDAMQDGAAQPGLRVTYMACALKNDRSQVHRFHIMVPAAGGRPGATRAEATPDVSDMAGVLVALMRTNNEQSQIVIKATQGRDDVYQRQIDNLSKQLEIEQKRALEATTLYHKLTSMQFEQQRVIAASKRAEENDEFIREKISDLVPFLLNRFAGGGPGKGAPGADPLLARIFERFTPEQIEELRTTTLLTDEQKLLFFELYQSVAMRAPIRKLNGKAEPAAEAKQEGGGNGQAS